MTNRQPLVEVEKSVNHYVLDVEVIETNKRYVVLKLPDGSVRTLYKNDHLILRWAEVDHGD